MPQQNEQTQNKVQLSQIPTKRVTEDSVTLLVGIWDNCTLSLCPNQEFLFARPGMTGRECWACGERTFTWNCPQASQGNGLPSMR